MTPDGEVRVLADKSLEGTDKGEVSVAGEDPRILEKIRLWMPAKDSHRCIVELARASGKNCIASDLTVREEGLPKTSKTQKLTSTCYTLSYRIWNYTTGFWFYDSVLGFSILITPLWNNNF